jgi:23S rRNA pseudouridine1911/1915/1917 synthase
MVICRTNSAHSNLKTQFQSHSLTKLYHCIVSGVLKEDHGLIKWPITRNRRERHKMAVIKESDQDSASRFDSNEIDEDEEGIDEDEAEIEADDPKSPKKAAGKLALTEYRVLESHSLPARVRSHPNEVFSLLEVRLHTGRTYVFLLYSLLNCLYSNDNCFYYCRHQIRVHMASSQLPIVGDVLYSSNRKRQKQGDRQLCLVAKYLRFKHPLAEKDIEFEVPYPPEFEEFLNHIRHNRKEEEL